MPVSYTKTSGQGHVYQVPDYPEAADAPKAFKDYSDFLDLILPPVGTIMPFVGNTAPTGWLPCNGDQYSSTTYPKLSALCGTKFGTASAGNFRVPDLRGRVLAGLDSSQTEFDTIGKTGGVKSVSLTVSNLPPHTHSNPAHDHTGSGTVTIGAPTGGSHEHSLSATVDGTTGNANTSHQHATRVGEASNFRRDGSNTGAVVTTAASGANTDASGAAHTHTFSASISGTTGSTADTHTHTGTVNLTIPTGGATTSGSTGGGTAVNTLNPYVTMNHIIRAA